MNEIVPHIHSLLDHIITGLPKLMPELVLSATFIASIFSGLFIDPRWRAGTFSITLLGMVITAIYSSLPLTNFSGGSLLFGMVVSDTFSANIRVLIGATCILFAVFVHANPDFTAHRKRTADLYSVLVAVHIGLNLMSIATHWLMLFVSIEMVSIGSYIMVGYLAKNAKQTEAAMKYALFGAVCSAIMLYGLSLIYGFTGNLELTAHAHVEGFAAAPSILTTVALLFVFTGIGFKLSFVPFHFWSPDVYQGAPTPVTAFLSTAPKIAGIALLIRVLYAWPAESAAFESLHFMLLVSAIATMLLGNLAALRQDNVKRMMAYSSIGHTGFLMMAVLAYRDGDPSVLLFYLAVYALMNMAVFMLIDYIESRTGVAELSGYKGLGKILAAPLVCFVILLVSLTGLPPTAGFVSKLLVFSSVVERWQVTGDAGLLLLLIVGALTTVISLFYYFKIPLNAFLKKPDMAQGIKPAAAVPLWLIIAMTAAVLILGIVPQLLIDWF